MYTNSMKKNNAAKKSDSVKEVERILVAQNTLGIKI